MRRGTPELGFKPAHEIYRQERTGDEYDCEVVQAGNMQDSDSELSIR